MPATNRVGLPSAEYYLKAQPPSWQALQTGLSIFALFVIVRYCVQRFYSWLRPAEERLNPTTTATSTTTRHPTTTATTANNSSNNNNNNGLSLQQRYHPHSWPMDEKAQQQGGQDARVGEEGGAMTTQQMATPTTTPTTTTPEGPLWRITGNSMPMPMPRPFVSRLPPAPPLTPPELSTAIFTLDQPSRGRENFIHQPNPDYMSSTSTSSFETDAGSESSSTMPRRRSYTKSVPVTSVPVSRQDQRPEAELAEPTFSPRSFPPSSQLPPAAPSGVAANGDGEAQRNVDVQGEIISVLDHDGAGWTRHTRVYGGSACLACAASGGSHGGGFYGATVTPEEMR